MVPTASSDSLNAHRKLVELLVRQHQDTALFLDVDGTLIDIAERPDAVVVPDALPALVAGLSLHLDGALALVSGRTITELDRLFAPISLASAGGHGAQLRLQAGEPVLSAQVNSPLPAFLVDAIAALAASDSRLLFENKATSIALHYRGAPEMASALREKVDALLAEASKRTHETPDLIAGKMIFEIKPAGFDKGWAISQFLKQPSFGSRRPIMIGDDTTDEAAFALVEKSGGLSFGVGRKLAGVQAVFDSPADVRLALAEALTGALNRMLNA